MGSGGGQWMNKYLIHLTFFTLLSCAHPVLSLVLFPSHTHMPTPIPLFSDCTHTAFPPTPPLSVSLSAVSVFAQKTRDYTGLQTIKTIMVPNDIMSTC